jgi:putative oxidoreductase
MKLLSGAGLLGLWEWLTSHLRGAGEVVPRLAMRIVMGWEFWEAGHMKLNGENWFADIQDKFPFPFNVVPADLSWTMATWTEIIGAVLLWLGLGTRLAAFSLLVVTFVAVAAVHWPDMWSMWSELLKGYAVVDDGYGNYKLPLLFCVMLLPLIFNGGGKLSLDHLLALMFKVDTTRQPVSDAYSWALAGVVLGIPMLMLMPKLGFVLLAFALACLAFGRFSRA